MCVCVCVCMCVCVCVCVCEKEGVCMATGFNFQEQGVIIGCEHWHCWWEDAESDFLRREAFSPDTHTHTHTIEIHNTIHKDLRAVQKR